MAEERRVTLQFPCPACSGTASPSFTRRELEAALEIGELDLYHISCDHRWKRTLEPLEKTNLAKLIEREL